MTDRAARLKSAIHAFSKFVRALFDLDRPQSYRPEAHYMRGPGPKWRARHGDLRRAVGRVSRSAGGRTL